MQRKHSFILVALMAVFLLFGAGCAKKRTSTPPGSETQVEVKDGYEWEEQDETETGQIDERTLTEEQMRAQKKEQAVQELRNRIHFGFDSYELSPESRDILQNKAEYMKRYPDVTMIIEGHCDDRGTEEYNLALGERRARAAYEFLILLGVEPERMSIVSFGEERPLNPAQNETAWAMNRRDEFRISE